MDFDLSRVNIETKKNIGDGIYKIILEAVKSDPYLCDVVEERNKKFWNDYVNYLERIGVDLSTREDLEYRKKRNYNMALESVVDELRKYLKE